MKKTHYKDLTKKEKEAYKASIQIAKEYNKDQNQRHLEEYLDQRNEDLGGK